MTVTVEQRILKVGGKEYPETITRQKGLQMVEFNGEMVEAEFVTICESKLGRSVLITQARAPSSPEERAANRRRVQEIAAQAMIDMGIW